MNDLTLNDEMGLAWYNYTQTNDEKYLEEYERMRKLQNIWKEHARL